MDSSILSEELLAELGEDAVLPSKSQAHEKKRSLSPAPPPPKMSKRQKRKLESIQKRNYVLFRFLHRLSVVPGKEKESKRSEYLKVLEKHKISNEQRTVMLSTRDIGQKLTMRNHLKLLFHKHKAGMRLSEEELALLFPRSASSEDMTTTDTTPYDDAELLLEKHEHREHASSSRADLEVRASGGDDPSRTIHEDARPVSSLSSAALSTSSNNESVGTRMLELIHQLRQREKHCLIQVGAPLPTEAGTEDGTSSMTPSEKYVPAPLRIPIGIEGVIANASRLDNSESSGRDAVSSGCSYVRVERDPEIQVATAMIV